ncbi:hypothetical protein BKA70DRAFT_1242076 [Coprinopsis sp. MPI-PUGE-AT-0042]|nr:hypothetical protein BKA70DRAFT_1242076 [Coprinopsis sp. MPI-PUGE-AT-0042]
MSNDEQSQPDFRYEDLGSRVGRQIERTGNTTGDGGAWRSPLPRGQAQLTTGGSTYQAPDVPSSFEFERFALRFVPDSPTTQDIVVPHAGATANYSLESLNLAPLERQPQLLGVPRTTRGQEVLQGDRLAPNEYYATGSLTLMHTKKPLPGPTNPQVTQPSPWPFPGMFGTKFGKSERPNLSTTAQDDRCGDPIFHYHAPKPFKVYPYMTFPRFPNADQHSPTECLVSFTKGFHLRQHVKTNDERYLLIDGETALWDQATLAQLRRDVHIPITDDRKEEILEAFHPDEFPESTWLSTMKEGPHDCPSLAMYGIGMYIPGDLSGVGTTDKPPVDARF